jgi:elongation factor Ts
MAIDAKAVKVLREKTGLGVMDCKEALTESAGDIEIAIEILRKKGLKVAEQRAGRDTKQGIIEAYIHTGGKIGVLVELNCETDFVARTDDFKALAKDICMQVAAADPKWIDPSEVSSAVLEKEKAIYSDQAAQEGKPANIVPKIVEGKINRYYEQVCLMEQGFIKDPDRKVKDIITEAVGKIGESIKIGRFIRIVLGEE